MLKARRPIFQLPLSTQRLNAPLVVSKLTRYVASNPALAPASTARPQRPDWPTKLPPIGLIATMGMPTNCDGITTQYLKAASAFLVEKSRGVLESTPLSSLAVPDAAKGIRVVLICGLAEIEKQRLAVVQLRG